MIIADPRRRAGPGKMAEMSEEELLSSFYGDEDVPRASQFGAQSKRSSNLGLRDLQSGSTTASVRGSTQDRMPLRELSEDQVRNVSTDIVTKATKISEHGAALSFT